MNRGTKEGAEGFVVVERASWWGVNKKVMGGRLDGVGNLVSANPRFLA